MVLWVTDVNERYLVRDAIFHYKVAGVGHGRKIKPFWAQFFEILNFFGALCPPRLGGRGGHALLRPRASAKFSKIPILDAIFHYKSGRWVVIPPEKCRHKKRLPFGQY